MPSKSPLPVFDFGPSTQECAFLFLKILEFSRGCHSVFPESKIEPWGRCQGVRTGWSAFWGLVAFSPQKRQQPSPKTLTSRSSRPGIAPTAQFLILEKTEWHPRLNSKIFRNRNAHSCVLGPKSKTGNGDFRRHGGG